MDACQKRAKTPRKGQKHPQNKVTAPGMSTRSPMEAKRTQKWGHPPNTTPPPPRTVNLPRFWAKTSLIRETRSVGGAVWARNGACGAAARRDMSRRAVACHDTRPRGLPLPVPSRAQRPSATTSQGSMAQGSARPPVDAWHGLCPQGLGVSPGHGGRWGGTHGHRGVAPACGTCVCVWVAHMCKVVCTWWSLGRGPVCVCVCMECPWGGAHTCVCVHIRVRAHL